ncbi:hypothetical protein BJH93_04155 [Kocuria polaris]|nr:hypothetical protein [Kocuria polaris]
MDQPRRKAGTALINTGVIVAVIGVIIAFIASSQGGEPTFWIILIGLVLLAIGFGQRVLAALERR